MGDEETLMNEMASMLDEADLPAGDPKPSPAIAIKDVPAAEEVLARVAPESPAEHKAAPSGHPNPLGIELTACHLPRRFLVVKGNAGKTAISRYVSRFIDRNVVRKLRVSPNEQKLYAEYQRLCRPVRPVTPRMFAACVRLICDGKPLDVEKEDPFDSLAL